jgi:hypothetical protein
MSKFFIALLLLSNSAIADEWRTSDTYRETAYQVLNIIDWGQTRYIAEHPERYREVGVDWAIGEHPSIGRVNNFMAGSAVVHFTVVYFLPTGWRDAFQYVTIGDKLNATTHNYSVGVKISF